MKHFSYVKIAFLSILMINHQSLHTKSILTRQVVNLIHLIRSLELAIATKRCFTAVNLEKYRPSDEHEKHFLDFTESLTEENELEIKNYINHRLSTSYPQLQKEKLYALIVILSTMLHVHPQFVIIACENFRLNNQELDFTYLAIEILMRRESYGLSPISLEQALSKDNLNRLHKLNLLQDLE